MKLSRPDYRPVTRRSIKAWFAIGTVLGVVGAAVSHLIPEPSSSKELPEPPSFTAPDTEAALTSISNFSSNFTVAGDAVIEGCLRIHALPHDLVIGICKSESP